MNQFSLLALRFGCSALFTLGAIQGFASEASSENLELGQHIEAGIRPLLKSEMLAIQERRSLEDLEAKCPCGDNKKKKDKTAVEIMDQAVKASGSEANIGLVPHEKASIYYTTHPGAFHMPISVGLYGESVTLEDGSLWTIGQWDQYKTLNWLTSDVILIMPNHSWFSLYNYKLVNQNTGAYVEADLKLFLNPSFHTVYNHRIVAIDDILQMVWLEDGSVWSVASCDYSTKWAIGDTVIIGINDGWLSPSKPNILINANILHYVRANSVN